MTRWNACLLSACSPPRAAIPRCRDGERRLGSAPNPARVVPPGTASPVRRPPASPGARLPIGSCHHHPARCHDRAEAPARSPHKNRFCLAPGSAAHPARYEKMVSRAAEHQCFECRFNFLNGRPGAGAAGPAVVDCDRDVPPGEDGARCGGRCRAAGSFPGDAAAPAAAGCCRETHAVCRRPPGARRAAAGSAAGAVADRGPGGARGSLARLGRSARPRHSRPAGARRRRRGRQLPAVWRDLYRRAASCPGAGGATGPRRRRPVPADRGADRRLHRRPGGARRERAAPVRPRRPRPQGARPGHGRRPAAAATLPGGGSAARPRGDDPDLRGAGRRARPERSGRRVDRPDGVPRPRPGLGHHGPERLCRRAHAGGRPGRRTARGRRGAAGRADRPGGSTSPTRMRATTSIRSRASSRSRCWMRWRGSGWRRPSGSR